MTSMAIVSTGTANVASVRAAMRRLGVEPVDVTHGQEVADASRVLVPGVGSFGAAMGALEQRGLRQALAERIDDGRPTLAVCVGMQLLGVSSTESPGVVGLGAVSEPVHRFTETVRVPQLGWNQVTPGPRSRYLEPGWAYFANSYRFEAMPEGWVCSTASYGGDFVAAMERGAVLALQFHPELSGEWGSALLARWLTATGPAT